MISFLLAAVVTLVGPQSQSNSEPANQPVVAQSAASTLTIETVEEAAMHLQTIDDLKARNVLTPEQAQAQEQYYLGFASKAAGHEMTRADVAKWGSREGYSLLGRIFAILAGLLVFLGACYLFRDFIAAMPKELWELVAYGGSVYLLFFTDSLTCWVLGGLLLAATLAFTLKVHFESGSYRFGGSIVSAVLTVVLAFAAMSHSNVWLGFMAVMALESFLGFSVIVTPMCYCVGFDKDDNIVRATCSSFVLLLIGLGIKQFHLADSTPALQVFEAGLLFMGSLVFFIGMLIITTKWYRSSNGRSGAAHYTILNVLMIAAIFASIFFGQTYGVSVLRGMAVAFLIFWVLDKSIEIAVTARSVALGFLLGGGALYGASWFCMNHTEYLLFTLNN